MQAASFVSRLRPVPEPADRPPIPNTLMLVREWDRFLGGNGLAPDTRRLHRYGVLRFLAEICPADFTEVTEDQVAGFIISLGTRNTAKVHYLAGLRSFFGWCHRRGHIAVDPTAAIIPKRPALPPVASLSDEELTRILLAAAWKDERRGWALLLQYSIGARRMELAAIRPEDVDLANGILRLKVTKFNKPRDVEIGPLALAALEGLRPWRSPTILGVKKQAITAWAEEAAALAELRPKTRGRTSHVLRATFATNLLARGIPISVVSELLGHSNIAVTSRYLAITKQARREAVEVL